VSLEDDMLMVQISWSRGWSGRADTLFLLSVVSAAGWVCASPLLLVEGSSRVLGACRVCCRRSGTLVLWDLLVLLLLAVGGLASQLLAPG
jgi:hypothetical protein